MNYFNPKLHDETQILSTGCFGFPMSRWPRPVVKPASRYVSTNVSLQVGVSLQQIETALMAPFAAGKDFLKSLFQELAPGRVPGTFLRTQIDFLNFESNDMQQMVTGASESQKLYLSKWRQAYQTIMWAEFCEARREMQTRLQPGMICSEVRMIFHSRLSRSVGKTILT